LQKKGHSMEFLREIAHLRPRTNTFGAVFRIRHNMAYAIHKFFHDRGFFYFHTPLITASDCEGAGQMFQVTTMNLYDLKKDENGSIVYDNDFFGKQASLTVSGQLEGELAATALGQIYTFGPTFRAENSNTPRHLAEFWMIEPEVAFNDILDNMQLAEEFIKYCVQWALDNCMDDIKFLNDMFDKGLIERLQGVLKTISSVCLIRKESRFWKRPLLKATRSSSRYIGVSTWLLSMNVSWLKSISNVR
jgi:asparaginyl-tRNA synthetase